MPGHVRRAVATAVLAAAVGASVFCLANAGPYAELAHSLRRGPAYVQHQLGLRAGRTSFVSVFGPQHAAHPLAAAAWDRALALFWALVLFFKHMLATRFARGQFLHLSMAVTPLVAHMFLEALREGSHTILLVGWFVAVLTVGQVVTFGAALNILFVPWYAAYRLRQARQPAYVPRAPPPTSALVFFQLLSGLYGGVAMLASFLPRDSSWWVPTNAAFQFSPLIFLPLMACPALRKATGARSDKKNHTGVIDLYWNLNLLVWLGYMFAMYLVWDELQLLLSTLWASRATLFDVATLVHAPATYLRSAHALAVKGGIASDGEWLLLFDILGVMLAEYFVVVIDMCADDYQVESTKIQRIHPPRQIHEDVRPASSSPLRFLRRLSH